MVAGVLGRKRDLYHHALFSFSRSGFSQDFQQNFVQNFNKLNPSMVSNHISYSLDHQLLHYSTSSYFFFSLRFSLHLAYQIYVLRRCRHFFNKKRELNTLSNQLKNLASAMRETEKTVAAILVLAGAIALTVYAFYEVTDSVATVDILLPLVNGSGACK
jgi:hypothetical protein